jgi:hypothetical protein
MGIMDIFKEPKSTEEIEADNEKLEAQDRNVGLKLSIAKQNAIIKELEARGKKWEDFSSNGKKSGINFDKIKSWFSSH